MRPYLLMVLAAWLAVPPAWAATYHVAREHPAAADTNAGTEAAPWKTLAKAAATVQAGDTVLIHQGVYLEDAVIRASGTARAPITFAAFSDDAVTLDGADPFPAGRWQPVPGLRGVFATPLDRDPGEVFVDGKPLYMKVRKLAPDNWELAHIGEQDRGLWEYDAKGKRLLLNVDGANPGAAHRLEIPVRATAFTLSERCVLRGVRIRRVVGPGVYVAGDDAAVEDCLVSRCGSGIVVAGWDCRGVVVRRNTVVECLNCGIFLQDRPTACRVEENLVVRCTLNPWHGVLWAGSVKMNSASDCLFAHNVVLEAGNPETINGWDGWSLWGDINVVRVVYLGNSTARNKEAGIYVEYAMGDTRAYFNTSYRDGHGITCRQSQRGVFMRNVILSSRGSGLAVWGGGEPYPTIDHLFAHNLVRDCVPGLRLQIEQPNFADYNTYWPRRGGPLADGEKGRAFATLEALRQATGHEAHGQVRDAQPEDVGLGMATFRVPDASDPGEVLGMVANQGCEFEDPAGQNILPYFWRPGTGDGRQPTFVYSAYTGLPGGVDTLAYGGAGGTVGLTTKPELAHAGNRCLEINGFEPSRIPKEGLGFWSPTLPARPGDTLNVSLWVRGKELSPASGSALSLLALFTGPTGQQRKVVDLAAGQPARAGTFEWQKVEGSERVPEGCRRVALFIGLRPAKGSLWVDDITFGVK